MNYKVSKLDVAIGVLVVANVAVVIATVSGFEALWMVFKLGTGI